MTPNFAVGIPTINRYDILEKSLMRYVFDFRGTQLFILDNGGQRIAEFPNKINPQIIRFPYNLGVAASWNYLAECIFQNHDYALVLNDDVYLGKTSAQVQEFLSHPYYSSYDFFVSEQHWCAFVLPKKTFVKIGAFDPGFFPAYFEDNDYAYRLKLAGLRVLTTPFLNPRLFVNSGSMKKNPELAQGFMANQEYYRKKWGGVPGEETYLHPFDKKKLNNTRILKNKL